MLLCLGSSKSKDMPTALLLMDNSLCLLLAGLYPEQTILGPSEKNKFIDSLKYSRRGPFVIRLVNPILDLPECR